MTGQNLVSRLIHFGKMRFQANLKDQTLENWFLLSQICRIPLGMEMGLKLIGLNLDDRNQMSQKYEILANQASQAPWCWMDQTLVALLN
nr:hypothetical protein BaRGS_017493 [Batillaria attramentaria]